MAKIPFTFRTGILDESSVRFSVYSFSSSDVTLDVDDGTATRTLTMIGRGLDGLGGAADSSDTYPIAMYTADIDISRLTNRKYKLTVTQDGVTRTGTTNPDLGDIDSNVIFLTCDSYGSVTQGIGSWAAIRDEIETETVQTIIHTDDHGYTGGLEPNDTGPGGTGRFSSSPTTDKTEYSRYLAYAAYLGLLETDASGTGYIPDFQETDRIWCKENCPQWASVGDWELINNPAEKATITTSEISAAKTAYLRTVGSTTEKLNESNSAAWVKTVGPLEVIAFDRCFSLTPLTSYYDVATEVNNIAANKLLGTGQMADLKGAIDNSSPFKILAMPMSAKHMTDASFRLAEKSNGWFNSSWFGGQQPLHDYTADTSGDAISYVSEWRELMTQRSSGVCAVAQSYGAPVIGLHGDTHRPYEYWMYFPQDDLNVELDMLECSSGPVCPAFAHRLHPKVKEKYYYRGTIVNWLASYTEQTSAGSPLALASYISLKLKEKGSLRIDYILADGVKERTVIHTHVVERSKPFTKDPRNTTI